MEDKNTCANRVIQVRPQEEPLVLEARIPIRPSPSLRHVWR